MKRKNLHVSSNCHHVNSFFHSSFFPLLFLAHFPRIITLLHKIHSLLPVSHLRKKRKNNLLDALVCNESIALCQQSSLRFAYDKSTSAFHFITLVLRIFCCRFSSFPLSLQHDFQLVFSKSSSGRHNSESSLIADGTAMSSAYRSALRNPSPRPGIHRPLFLYSVVLVLYRAYNGRLCVAAL